MSMDDAKHSAALYEVYLRALFDAQGFAVEIHPHVMNSPNRPDYLLSKPGASFYVEAITIGLPSDKQADQNRLMTLLDGRRRRSALPAFNAEPSGVAPPTYGRSGPNTMEPARRG
jgi:hypothetical protein